VFPPGTVGKEVSLTPDEAWKFETDYFSATRSCQRKPRSCRAIVRGFLLADYFAGDKFAPWLIAHHPVNQA
jgi:hypothetical protein